MDYLPIVAVGLLGVAAFLVVEDVYRPAKALEQAVEAAPDVSTGDFAAKLIASEKNEAFTTPEDCEKYVECKPERVILGRLPHNSVTAADIKEAKASDPDTKFGAEIEVEVSRSEQDESWLRKSIDMVENVTGPVFVLDYLK